MKPQPGERVCPSHPVLLTGTPRQEAQPGPRTLLCSPEGPAPSRARGHPLLCPHSDIHLAALPPEHTIAFLLRLLPETPREAFALWQVAAQDFQPVLGVLLDGQLWGERWAPVSP